MSFGQNWRMANQLWVGFLFLPSIQEPPASWRDEERESVGSCRIGLPNEPGLEVLKVSTSKQRLRHACVYPLVFGPMTVANLVGVPRAWNTKGIPINVIN